jgi:hypothetical protein
VKLIVNRQQIFIPSPMCRQI